MTKCSVLVFKYLSPEISLKNGSVLKTNLWVSRFKWDWPQTMGTFHFLKNQTESMVQPLKVFLKGCIVDFALFLQKLEASMVGVSLIWNVAPRGSFWVLNHFLGIFPGRDICKKKLQYPIPVHSWYFWAEIFEKQLRTFGQSLIFNVNLQILKNQG